MDVLLKFSMSKSKLGSKESEQEESGGAGETGADGILEERSKGELAVQWEWNNEVKKGGLCDFLILWTVFNRWMVNLDKSDTMCTLSSVVMHARGS